MKQLSMTRGDTKSWTIAIATAAGAPYPLTNCVLWFSVRRKAGAVGYIFQKKTGGDGITIPDPATGRAIVQLDTADTAGLPAEEQIFAYDVQIKTASTPAGIFTIQKGPFVVAPDITTETS